MVSDIEKKLKEIIENEVKNNKDSWNEKSKFFSIKKLSIDQRGRVGEHFLKRLFEELNLKIKYENDSHGDHDIVVENYKIEVKTATLDKNNKFQHEGIKNSDLWDFVCFVDISPNEIFITFISKSSFYFENKFPKIKTNDFEQKIHFRGKDNSKNRATGAGYKVDFKISQLKCIENIENFKKLWEYSKNEYNKFE